MSKARLIITAVARGVVNEGSVGLAWAVPGSFGTRSAAGVMASSQTSYAVGSPQQVSEDAIKARRVLELVPFCPALTWGIDELRAGEMWNSNSLISRLLAPSGHDTTSLHPPCEGAPGWTVGLGETEIGPESREGLVIREEQQGNRENKGQRSLSQGHSSSHPWEPFERTWKWSEVDARCAWTAIQKERS